MSNRDRPRRQVDEEIDVARVVGFTTGDRAEDPNIPGTVSRRGSHDLRPL